VEGSAPSKTRKTTVQGVRAGYMGALATLGSLPHQSEKNRMMGKKPGQAITLSVSHLEPVDLRREQLESKHCEKPSHRKEGETNHGCCQHSLWKRRNGGTTAGHSGRIALRRDQCDVYTCCLAATW
jgi:hypothetical protein